MDERDTDAVRAEIRDALSDFLADAWERLGDVPGSRWARLVWALVIGVAISWGFKSSRRRHSR